METMSRDDEMLRGCVDRTVADIIAEVAARRLLEQHADEYVGDLADAGTLLDRLIGAREVLELEPSRPAHDETIGDGLDDLPRLFEDALEIRREGYSTEPGVWLTERVRVCVGLGGPNLFVYTDGDRAWVDGYWGGSKREGVYFDSATADAIASELDYLLSE